MSLWEILNLDGNDVSVDDRRSQFWHCCNVVRDDLLRKAIRAEFQKGHVEGGGDVLNALAKHSAQDEDRKRKINPYMFITINPKPEVKLDLFKKLVLRYCKRSMIKQYLCVFEQRAAEYEEVGKGFHAHILIERDVSYPPSKVRKNTYNSFKNVVGNPKHVDIPTGKQVVNNRQKYMLELKKQQAKRKSQIMNLRWRKENNLFHFYGNLFHISSNQFYFEEN